MVHLLSALEAPQIQGIESLLFIDHIGQPLRNGLTQDNLGIEPCLFI